MIGALCTPSEKENSMFLKHLVGAFTLTAVCLVVSPVVGQTARLSGSRATITVDGTLLGNVRSLADAAVPDAQVSLVLQGKVIDVAHSDGAGKFSFPDINPGQYQIVCSFAGMVSAQPFDIGPCLAEGSAIPANLILEVLPPELAYESIGSVPLASLNRVGGWGSSGAGMSSGSGIGLAGRLGGGTLSSPRGLVLAGGLIGGLAAIDGDDASPSR